MATKRPKAGLREADVLSQVLEAARCFGLDLDRRNTGAMVNPHGQPVRFGKPGDSDTSGTLSDGRTIHVEVKDEFFDPSKLHGKARDHFGRQLARLRKTNELGGIGMWVRSSKDFVDAMIKVLDGWKVDIDEAGYCWLVSPDEPKEV